MPGSTYSTNLKIELMATGENSGTWGNITNTNLGTALEQAIVGYGNPEYTSDANLTISITNSNAAQAARALVLNVTSTVSLTGTRELVVPTIQKQYIVQNNTTGSQSITVKTSAGTGITVPNGRKAHLYVDGTNVVQMFDFVDINGGAIDGTDIGASTPAAGNFTTVDATNVEVTNVKAKDGTAAATIADSTGVVTVSQAPVMSALTASQAVFTTAGKALVSNAITGSGNVVMSASPTLTGTVAGASLQLSSLTSGRVTYAGASGLLQDSANLTFNGTDLTVSGAVNAGTVNATTFDMTNLEVTNIKAKDGTAAASIADSTGIITVSTQLNVDNLNLSGNTLSSTNSNGDISLAPNGNGSVVITNAGTSNALRITQTGSGNALLVEDSANPDATPVVIDASGQIIVGNTTATGSYAYGTTGRLQMQNAYGVFSQYSSNTNGNLIDFVKSRSNTIGSHTVVQSGDALGGFYAAGSDGTAFIPAAQIVAFVDGTPGTNDMPGRLVFSTTADGASTPTERMRIDSAGNVGIGTTAGAGQTLRVAKTITGNTSAYGVLNSGAVQSDVTSDATMYRSTPSTAAASFTLPNLYNFSATQGSFGAGSTVTNQFGFYAESNLTGATNNYGFYSNIASGTGRWNLYANGTARNYFAGNTGIGADSGTQVRLLVSGGATGSTAQIGLRSNETIQSDVTNSYQSVDSLLSTQAAAFTLSSYNAYRAGLGALGASSVVSAVNGFNVLANLAVGTSNYAFRGQFASAANTFNLYMEGTADNFFGGPTTISVNSSSNALRITQVGTGNALVVEDSANPDSSPFVVDASGRVGIGIAAPGVPLQVVNETQANITLNTGPNNSQIALRRANTSTTSPSIVASGDDLGIVAFDGYDGAAYRTAAWIRATVDGTPGTNDMPGRLVFSTTADGASSPTERMRIDSAGNVGIGTSSSTLARLTLGGTYTDSSGNVQPIRVTGVSPSTNTSSYFGITHQLNTTAASYTLPTASHFLADQGTIGAGSVITNQYGYFAGATLIGATNNYGFYSNIASGTGRWNFYANGSADNYFGGSLALGGTTTPGASGMSLRVGLPMTGVSNEWVGILNNGQVRSGVTGNAYMYRSVLDTQAASFTLTNHYHYYASQSSIGAGSAVTNQYGFVADSTIVGATNNYGFFGAVPSGTNRWNFYASGTADNFFGGPTTISVNSSSNALRITQTGAGNALVVEDSANPDATPFVVTSGGNVIVGTTTTRSVGQGFQAATNSQIFNELGSSDLTGITTVLNRNDANPVTLILGKSRGTTPGSVTTVQNNDNIGQIRFAGADGTSLDPIAAAIIVGVDGTPGTNDMPGRLVFSTTADGASTPTERMRIDSAGNVGIGGTPTTGSTLTVLKNITGAVDSYGIYNLGVVQSDVTTSVRYFQTAAQTAAASFTLPTLRHFFAVQSTFGAGSAVTNQFGFSVAASLTGATNNYGFYSDIASGTGRWNFYANGTAQNYFEGLVGLKTTANNGGYLEIGGTANVVSNSGYGVTQYQTIPSTATSQYWLNTTVSSTAAASFTLSDLRHYNAGQGTFGAGSTVTNQYGFFAQGTLIGATNNFGFYSNIASGTGRWNFYANGTAQNYFAGNTLIGTTTNTNSSALVVNGSISETVSSVQYLVASQYDVGTDPNEIPVNGYLGALAFMDSQFQQLAVGTGITGGTGTICKTSSGMEGGISVTRILIDLTGLNSGGTAGDIIGVNGTANPCYILALPSVTVLGGRMTCLEAPAGGDTDIDLYSATEATGVEDQAITALTETQLINGGVQALGTTTYFAADPTFNGYLYLVGQGTANATYTAGRFLIEIFGVQP